MSRGELAVSRWLEAHIDRSAGLATFPRNAILADVAGDGDHRLVLTDLKFEGDPRCRLKIYKGTLLTSDQVLQDVPCCLISFYTDNLDPKIPAVAVACGSDVFIYKNSKPFFKFKSPPCALNPLEFEVWKKFKEAKNDEVQKFVEDLKNIPYGSLSARYSGIQMASEITDFFSLRLVSKGRDNIQRSQQLLSLPATQCFEFIKKYIETTPIKENPITCMTSLKRISQDPLAISCPVVGTEFGIIYFLDPQNYSILHQANSCSVKATPFILKATGLFDVEFRVVIASREGHICILRRGWLEGKSLVRLTKDIVDMELIPGDNFIVVGTVDKVLHCYTKRGQRLWSSNTINSISCLCLVPLRHLSTHLVAVGMKGGPVHLFKGRTAVDFTSVPDTPSTIVFGQLGQEEHVMVVITVGGTITFKILKRTAEFGCGNQESGPVIQSRPLPLPKRSKLFLEQSVRERQNAMEIHQTFQQDLIRLRLRTARELVQNLSDQSGVGNEKEQVKLSAQVLGLGPKFTVILSLENMNTQCPIEGYTVAFHANPSIYVLSSYVVMVPLIPPSLSYKIETKVQEIIEEGSEEEQKVVNLSSGQTIRVFVTKMDGVQPVLAASIAMPPTEFIF